MGENDIDVADEVEKYNRSPRGLLLGPFFASIGQLKVYSTEL